MVMHIAADEEYAKGLDAKYGNKGFMHNIHVPKNLLNGEGEISGIASLNILKEFE